MKANVFKIIPVALFLFVTSNMFASTETEASIYHNVRTYDNVVSTSYFKKSGKNENMIPFKKKVKTLDEHGVCTSKITYVFDMNSKSWQLSDKMEYTYVDGKLVSIQYSDWNKSKNTWDTPQVTSYAHTDNNILSMN